MSADPLLRFEAEHREALAALERLERAALALSAGSGTGGHLATVREVYGLLAGAVRVHNENEERALFALLGEEAPTALFVEEHRKLWELERELEEALEAADVERTARVALTLAELLRAHIERENQMLFPMARGILGSAGLDEVARRMAEEADSR